MASMLPQTSTYIPHNYKAPHGYDKDTVSVCMDSSKQSDYGSQIQVDRYGFVGGEQFTHPDAMDSENTVEKLRKRETKWLNMLNNWDKSMSKNYIKVKERCRKGIPPAIRSRAWQYLCGSASLLFQNKDVYQSHLSQPGNVETLYEIEKDIGRQFPQHEDFSSQNGYCQRALFNILKVYTIMKPEVGYCQAHAPIAAALLIHMPEEEAFWTFYMICERYLPGYYNFGLERILIDCDIFYSLMKRYIPSAYRHLTKNDVKAEYFMVDWFMCLFTRNLPWATVLRVFDMFFCEGVKVIFRISLCIIRALLGSPENQHQYNTLEDIVSLLRNLPPHITNESFIVKESLKFVSISSDEMVREHIKCKKLRDKMKQDQLSNNCATR